MLVLFPLWEFCPDVLNLKQKVLDYASCAELFFIFHFEFQLFLQALICNSLVFSCTDDPYFICLISCIFYFNCVYIIV